MRNFILAAACVLTVTFATSTAMADRYGHRHSAQHHGPSYHHHGHGGHYVTPYHAYRHSPAYSSRYYGYRSPYYGQVYHHNYHYARPGYSSNAFGVQSGNFSLYLGF
jgi:hypothetical protein